MNSAQSLRKYYQTDRYKGFYKIKKRFDSTSRLTFLVFSNGKKQIFASGIYTEDAMFKAFQAIDQYLARKKYEKNLFLETQQM